jgi:ABC-type cobalamin transport system ATPase subunit
VKCPPWSITETNLRYAKHRLLLAQIAQARAEADVRHWQQLVDSAQAYVDELNQRDALLQSLADAMHRVTVTRENGGAAWPAT